MQIILYYNTKIIIIIVIITVIIIIYILLFVYIFSVFVVKEHSQRIHSYRLANVGPHGEQEAIFIWGVTIEIRYSQ